MKVLSLSAQRAGRLYPQINIPSTHFCYRLSRLQAHSEAGRITAMQNSNDKIGKGIRPLTARSAVPQTTAPPRAPYVHTLSSNILRINQRRFVEILYNPNNYLGEQICEMQHTFENTKRQAAQNDRPQMHRIA